MTNNDLNAFCTLWNNMYANYGKGNAPDGVLTTAFNALREYEFKDIAEIVRQALVNCEYLPALATIKKGLDRLVGMDVESLKIKALEMWRLINSHLGEGNDLVIDDDRTCYAIEKCFGSLFSMSSEQSTEYKTTKAQESFVNTFSSVKKHDLVNINHVFIGHKNQPSNRTVEFIGDPERCLKWGRQQYPLNTYPNPHIDSASFTLEMRLRTPEDKLNPKQKQSMCFY